MNATIAEAKHRAAVEAAEIAREDERLYADLLRRLHDNESEGIDLNGSLSDLGRTMGDLERDLRIYSKRRHALELKKQRPELIDAMRKAQQRRTEARKQRDEQVKQAEAQYRKARSEESAATNTADRAGQTIQQLKSLIPGWIVAERDSLNAELESLAEPLSRPVWHDQDGAHERAGVIRQRLDDLRQYVSEMPEDAWPLPPLVAASQDAS